MGDLAERVATLEATQSILKVKANYWRAIDAGMPDAAAACLTSDVQIDFEGMGEFADRDSFISAIRPQANVPGHYHIHHGLNPQIEVISESKAAGTWQIRYQGIFTDTRTVVNMSGFYEDTYRKVDSVWLIASMKMRQHTMVSTMIADNGAPSVVGLPTA